MEAAVLPALAITIMIALVWLSTKWLGKKEDRALTGLEVEPDELEIDRYNR